MAITAQGHAAPAPPMGFGPIVEPHHTDMRGHDIQLNLILDYAKNIEQYRQVHHYFRRHQPPTLVIWEKNDPFFLPAGAEAFMRDYSHAEVHFLDTGHFALETHGREIADQMLDFFLGRYLPKDAHQ